MILILIKVSSSTGSIWNWPPSPAQRWGWREVPPFLAPTLLRGTLQPFLSVIIIIITIIVIITSSTWHQRCLSEPLNLFLAAPLLVQPLIQDSTTATDRLRSNPNSNKVFPTCVILHLTLCHGQRKDLKKKKSKMQETPLPQDCVLSWPWMKSALAWGRSSQPANSTDALPYSVMILNMMMMMMSLSLLGTLGLLNLFAINVDFLSYCAYLRKKKDNNKADGKCYL